MSKIPEPGRTTVLAIVATLFRATDLMLTQMARNSGDKQAQPETDSSNVWAANQFLDRVEQENMP